MLLKLAIRNIRRSLKDYAIYFATLTIGVALFYSFNSIEGQELMLDIESKASGNIFEVTKEMMALFSVVIAAVMGLLVIYSNRFLIKRRKKEFGTYLLLGMKPSSVSAIVLIETLLVGIISLIIGLLLGVALSQGLCFVTAAMFETKITNYQFIFSDNGCFLTVICFVTIFIVVALFNTVSVSMTKLINLINADDRNERGGVRNPWICLAVFIISIGILVYAYQQLIESGLLTLDDPRFIRATIGMLVGTLLFFWSLAGFAIAVLSRLKGFYFRGIRVFTIRQIASKINTAFLSLWAVCVMLFFSITIFSTGMGLVSLFTGDVVKANPYDASLIVNVFKGTPSEHLGDEDTTTYPASDNWDILDKVRQADPEAWDDLVQSSAQFSPIDYKGFTYQDLMGSISLEGINEEVTKRLEKNAEGLEISILSLSNLNELRTLSGDEPIEINEDECLMVDNNPSTVEIAKRIVAANVPVTIEGQTLSFVPQICDTQFYDSTLLTSTLYIVVADDVYESALESGSFPSYIALDIQYKDGIENGDELLEEITKKIDPVVYEIDDKYVSLAEGESLFWHYTATYCAQYMITQAGGMRMLITYLALYIGFIFLMTTATIIALQQLSNTTDSLPRYALLSKLGCDRKMLNISLLVQVLIYFFTPLLLAISHSICAVGTLAQTMFVGFRIDIAQPVTMSAVLVLIIYGTYLAITYFTSRSIIKSVY